MLLFSLSTAEQGASMALFEDGALVCESYWASRQTHSRRILSMAEQMIETQAGLTISDIDKFVGARGPGSFTGLRIGISVIKGLAYAGSKPCAGISSLDGVAYKFCNVDTPVCVMMDAKRNEVYSAVYQFNQGILTKKSEEMVCPPETAVDLAGPDALFVGSGSKAYKGMIIGRTNNQAVFSHSALDFVSASALAQVALDKDSVFDSAEYLLTPVYLRKSDAEIHFSKKPQS
ncbi:MAG: tRNA (adenosine(37)-N6)-threonylcarbamoyltransferase complex dimerization subunit type 1 TsaB [Desulfobacterales bacterium]|nr:tRNA (adenosine(37)-N6)-threonylcarbamoyltransferase complex dimerization subunit type 1 TsaB [Desulfobacterales bacterium]